MKRRNFIVLVAFLLVLIFAGCKQQGSALLLKQIGPVEVKAGQDFNVQPNGQSAMWAKTENATKTTIIMWENVKLHTTFGNPNNVTALVPKELYSKPGQFQVYLLDTKTGAKSNSLMVVVK